MSFLNKCVEKILKLIIHLMVMLEKIFLCLMNNEGPRKTWIPIYLIFETWIGTQVSSYYLIFSLMNYSKFWNILIYIFNINI